MSNPKVNEKIVLREEGDEAFLFNPDSGDIKILNETGLFIWKLCNGKNSKNDIISKIMDHYEADRKTVEKDVEELLLKFKEDNLLSYD